MTEPTASEPTDDPEQLAEADKTTREAAISFKQFLETVHPSVMKNISDLWYAEVYQHPSTGRGIYMAKPELRLHCQECEGERTFRSDTTSQRLSEGSANGTFISYHCGDCRKQTKLFSLWSTLAKAQGVGVAYKYGEFPPFGVPVPNKVLRLFGERQEDEDRKNFLKGRQCENQGLGVGAFAYYRRTVENHKNEIFDEIIKVCQTVGASRELIDELGSAKNEISFSKAIEGIKTALPQGLLIDGHNPLLALHGALSVGLHDESDDRVSGNGPRRQARPHRIDREDVPP